MVTSPMVITFPCDGGALPACCAEAVPAVRARAKAAQSPDATSLFIMYLASLLLRCRLRRRRLSGRRLLACPGGAASRGRGAPACTCSGGVLHLGLLGFGAAEKLVDVVRLPGRRFGAAHRAV